MLVRCTELSNLFTFFHTADEKLPNIAGAGGSISTQSQSTGCKVENCGYMVGSPIWQAWDLVGA